MKTTIPKKVLGRRAQKRNRDHLEFGLRTRNLRAPRFCVSMNRVEHLEPTNASTQKFFRMTSTLLLKPRPFFLCPEVGIAVEHNAPFDKAVVRLFACLLTIYRFAPFHSEESQYALFTRRATLSVLDPLTHPYNYTEALNLLTSFK